MYFDYKYEAIRNMTPEEILDYLRKSRSDDPLLTVEEVLSKHEEELDRWAIANVGAKIPESNKYREVVSGETIKDRPEITALLKRIESPKIKAVAVVEPQRLTRGDLEDIGRLMKLFKHSNTWVITPQRIYDLRDEYDWDAFERELKRGNDYLEYTKKILNRGRLLSVSQGNYIGTIPPYGYDKTTVMDGKRKCPTLKINEEQAEVVRTIFDMYVNKDMGRTSIAHTLDDMGIKPPKGERWSPSAMKDLLENIHYIGKVKWNWRKTIKIVEDSEIIATRPKSKVGEYLVYDGKHEAIISEELFQAARDKQGRNHKAKSKTKVRNPLAGLLYCSCGRAMSLRTYKKDGVERSEARLLCDDQVHCQTGSVLYKEMIDYVSKVLKNCIEDFQIKLDNNDGNSYKLHANLIKNLEKRKKVLEEKELSQWEAQADPDESKRMPQAIFQQLNAKLLKEKDEIQQALRKAYESMPEPVDYEKKIAQFQLALDTLNDEDAPAQKKNTLLKQCVERIEYSREKPERIKSQQKRVYIDGIRKSVSPLNAGANWTNPPFTAKVILKV